MVTSETNRGAGAGQPLRIEKLVYGGAGLGRIEGRAIMAPYVLPGELVEVEVKRERPGMAEARVIEIVTSSPDRIAPACPYFARCGGCHYQHCSYEYQLAQKTAILREVFERIGKLEAPEEIVVLSGQPWEYRNRAQFHLDAGRIGFLEAGSHRLCPVEQCPISSPRINEALARLHKMAGDRRFPRFVHSIELFTNEEVVQLNVLETDKPVARGFFTWCAEQIPGAAEGVLDYRAGGETFRVGHRSFFQVNRFLIDSFIDCAIEGASGGWALDLYAGVGLFSLPLARRFEKVVAIESNTSAVRDLEFNATRAGLSIEAQRTAAEEFLATLGTTPDFVLADPPRAGLGKRATGELLRLRPPRLTIASCDPATLARDLAVLLGGGYQIEKLTLADLFPQTYHIETVTHLKLA
ncbi:MAG: class I SAM-dependent RNA methyltransferase [Bryobacteraceae bacterium]